MTKDDSLEDGEIDDKQINSRSRLNDNRDNKKLLQQLEQYK